MAQTIEDFYKFPRTSSTSVSRDDLVLAASESSLFHNGKSRVVVEEKIDGANLGIRITEDYQITFQNRSHFVNTSTHKQFSTLDKWCEEHRGELFEILRPGRDILFGEWMYAKHSIHYTSLPGTFIAFDVYDTSEGKFLSVDERNALLQETTIPIIRCIHDGPISSKSELLSLVESRSTYYDGPVEGVYLRRFNDDGQLVQRAKIVRADFIAGIEDHWAKAKFVKNIVMY